MTDVGLSSIHVIKRCRAQENFPPFLPHSQQAWAWPLDLKLPQRQARPVYRGPISDRWFDGFAQQCDPVEFIIVRFNSANPVTFRRPQSHHILNDYTRRTRNYSIVHGGPQNINKLL